MPCIRVPAKKRRQIESGAAMTRSRRTPDELRAASDHLFYEVGMFDATARRLAAGIAEGTCKNALLESFAVHTRALLQFFFPTNVHDGDVLAVDYFHDPIAWKKLRGGRPRALDSVNDRVGAEIVHLTYERQNVTPEAKGWNVGAIHVAMMGLIRTFLDNIPLESLGAAWSNRDPRQCLPATVIWTSGDTRVNTPTLTAAFKTKKL